MTYAKGTSVSVEKSHVELYSLLGKHGASKRGIMTDDARAMAVVYFEFGGRGYQLEVPLPSREALADPTKPHYQQPKGARLHHRWQWMSVEQRKAWVNLEYDQLCRERWRAVVLLLKAKLELIQLGVRTAEQEFLADLVLPSGHRLHDALVEGRHLPPLLGPANGERK